MLRSLNSRLLFSYVFVILVCLTLVVLGLFLFALNSPLWLRAATLDLEVDARATLYMLRQAGTLDAVPINRLQTLLRNMAEEQNTRILLLDGQGTVRFDSKDRWVGEQLEEPARASDVRGRIQGVFAAPAGGRWVFFGQVVPAASGDTRLIVLFVSRPQVLPWFVENLLPPVVRAGVVALVLSILLALLVSRSVAGPLRRVAGAAEAIARGETRTRAPVSGPAEVRGLARSFNTMADQVEAAQRSQRDFVANVSHDLKTPLTSIQGFSQALLDGTASTPETTARAARVIHEEAGRMRRMVDELLILARFDAGQIVMARNRVELGLLLRKCVEKLSPQAQAASVTLELDALEDLSITGDADRLAQVFANLLDNSVAHTPAGGRVTVAAHSVEAGSVGGQPERREIGNMVEVTITDTGEGIPSDDIPRIFERFYQVDKARKRSRGTGLGLAITKEIVEIHGGTITAESVVGLGTRFTVRLPARQLSP
jgi:two-component system OmpR family sensor kinase